MLDVKFTLILRKTRNQRKSTCLGMLKSLVLGDHSNPDFSFLDCSFIDCTQGSSWKNVFEGCDAHSSPWHREACPEQLLLSYLLSGLHSISRR